MTIGGSIEGGGGNINSLGGVTITSPTNGQYLIYDATSGNWINSNGGGSSGYVTIQGQGTSVAQQTTLNFTSAIFSVTNDSVNSRTNIAIESPIPIANGGTGQSTQTAAFDALSPLTTKGDIIVYNGTDNVRLPVGTNGYVLVADSSASSGLTWSLNPLGAYDTVENAGSALTQRNTLNFSGNGITAADNSGAARTDVSLAATLVDVAGLTPTSGDVIVGNGTHFTTGTAYQTVQNDTIAVTQRNTLNLTGLGITAVDDSGNGSTDISLASTLQDIANLNPSAGNVIVGNSGSTHFIDGTAANILDNYSPVNYTATSATVDGNFAGIDSKLGSIVGAAITSLTGDVVATGPGAAASTIQSNVVTNAKLAQAAADTIKGNNTGSTANVADLTATQVTAMLNTFVGDSGSGGTKGLVPAPGANTYGSGDFLNAGGTWSYVDQSKTINPNFSLVTQGPVPSGSAGTIKYESTTIFTSIVTGKNYAIGVGFIGTPTLTIWDISDQTNPVITGTFVAAGGGAYNCTVGVVSGVQYAFVGYNSGSHFVVINLTNLASPVQTSSTVITGSPGSIYGVSFLNGYVYCATQSAGLVVMDVGGGTGSPGTPVQTFTQGSPYKSFGVVAVGTNVFTTYYSTSSPYTTRQIISWTLTGLGSPSVPSLVQSLQVTAAGEALGLSVSGNTAFVTTAATGAYNINLVDITTPSAMTNLSQINSTNAFDSAFYAIANGNYVYVPSGANATYGGAIDVYDITNRSSPIHIAQVTTGNANEVFGGIALSGGYIFCANYGIAASNNGSFDVFTQINANAIIGEMLSSTAYVESLTPSTALVSSASNEIISSVTTATELSYVHGVTSSIQAQINALSGGFTWNNVTGTSQTLAANNGYFANNASVVTFTLPTSSNVGDTYQIENSQGGWTVAQNAGQSIRVGNIVTTSGTGGSISSNALGDWITIVCNAANTGFVAKVEQGQQLSIV